MLHAHKKHVVKHRWVLSVYVGLLGWGFENLFSKLFFLCFPPKNLFGNVFLYSFYYKFATTLHKIDTETENTKNMFSKISFLLDFESWCSKSSLWNSKIEKFSYLCWMCKSRCFFSLLALLLQWAYNVIVTVVDIVNDSFLRILFGFISDFDK